MEQGYKAIRLDERMAKEVPVNVVKEAGCIVIVTDGHEYDIDDRRCDTPEKVCKWVVHLCGKNWVDTATIRDFVIMAVGEDKAFGV